jgi:glucose-6-phosphate 1-dehydrogenase
MKHAVQEFGRDEFNEEIWDWLAEGMLYVGDRLRRRRRREPPGGGPERARRVSQHRRQPRLLPRRPPDALPVLVDKLGRRRETEGWTRVVVEKPFGRDLARHGS